MVLDGSGRGAGVGGGAKVGASVRRLAAAAALILAATGTAAPGARAATWALLVGCGKFQNSFITPLNFPAADATSIRDALTDPTIGRVPASNVRLLTDSEATRANILGAVDTFLRPGVKPGDRVIVYLASHGVAKGFGPAARSYLLPSDARGLTREALEASAVDLKQLSSSISALPAAEFIVFMDACREDPTPGRGSKPNDLSDILVRDASVNVPTGHPAEAVTFFACQIGERAYEDPDHQHGAFTYWILEGLKHGPVPTADGTVDVRRLARYVTAQVEAWTKAVSQTQGVDIEQTPHLEAPEALNMPVILVKVSRPVSGQPVAPEPAVTPAVLTSRGFSTDAGTGLDRGFTMVSGDTDGSHKNQALGIFTNAVAAEPDNARAHYGLGYARRHFALFEKDRGRRDLAIRSAIPELQSAIDLQPDYYAAHRELAFCYHLLGDKPAALREYQMADATRGQANSADDVSGDNVAMSAIYKERGDPKAADGCMADARETTPDLSRAIQGLTDAGLKSQLVNYLPADARRVLDAVRDPVGEGRRRLDDGIRSALNHLHF